MSRGVQKTSEFERVLSLPRRTDTCEDLIDPLSAHLRKEHVCLPGCAGGVIRLNLMQVQALVEAHDRRGLFLQGPIGSGKTAVSMLLATVLGAQRLLLVIPGGSIVAKTIADLKTLREHWRIPAIEIVTYEFLQQEVNADYFWKFAPDVIVFDESHRIKDKHRSVTRRTARFHKDHPEVVICVMSGTPAKRSINDFAHTMHWALREWCPLPVIDSDLRDWSLVLDAGVKDWARIDPGALSCFGGNIQQIRRGVRDRMFSTPGCIASDRSEITSKLLITLKNVPLSPEEDACYQILHDDWTTPDGHTFTDAKDMWRYERQLARGFYNIWWNGDGFRECLTKTLKKNEQESSSAGLTKRLTINATEKKILSVYMHMTEPDTRLVQVVARLTSANPTNDDGICGTDTGLHLNNMLPFLQNMTDAATSAKRERVILREEQKGAGLSLLTTTILQGKLEAYFALSATEQSLLWETVLRAYPGLLPIFKQAIAAARPPKWWLEPRKAWHKAVRETLARSHTIDTAKQVASAIAHNPKHKLAPILAAWKEVEDKFTPNAVPVWVGNTALLHAAKWLEGGGIAWTEHVAFGKKLALMTGLPYFGEDGKSQDGRRSIVTFDGPACIASWEANGTGHNLQRYDRGLITSMWPTATIWDQTMGRQHRQGQKSDVVRFDVAISCRQDLAGFERASNEDGQFHKDLLAIPSRLVDNELRSDKISQYGHAWKQAKAA